MDARWQTGGAAGAAREGAEGGDIQRRRDRRAPPFPGNREVKKPGSVRPAKLVPGMTIGVIAPSSAIRDERLEKGIAALEEAGYKVVPGDHLYDRYGYLS